MRVPRPAWPLLALLALVPAAATAADEPAKDAGGAAVAAIRFYQRHLSSLRGGHCRFDPGCSEYAAQAIAAYGPLGGAALAADRLIRCNRAAAGFYRRGADGRLLDPVRGEAEARGIVLPPWLRGPDPGPLPPFGESVSVERERRARETASFAGLLALRGDREHAAIEFQRAAELAGAPGAGAWAFAAMGRTHWAAGDWAAAERSFLQARALAWTPEERARDTWRAALSRFAAGRFAACESLLAGPGLAPDSAGAPTREQRTVLVGLCALGRGGWSRAAATFAPLQPTGPWSEALQQSAARGPTLPHRSPALATALSIAVPGAGQAYCGRGADAVRHLLFDGALIWTVATLARDRHVPAAFVAAGFALPFYSGNVIGAGASARAFNRARRVALVAEATRTLDR